MASKSGLNGKKVGDFLSKLSDLVGSLPSQEEKSQIDRDLTMLIGYLEEVRRQLELVPTSNQIDSSSINRLRELMKAVDVDPVLSRVLGFSARGRRVGREGGVLADEARSRAREVARELETLSGDEVQHKLVDNTYSVAMLRQIGGELGIRIPSKARRSSVVDTIAGKLANRRGYKILRHGGHA